MSLDHHPEVATGWDFAAINLGDPLKNRIGIFVNEKQSTCSVGMQVNKNAAEKISTRSRGGRGDSEASGNYPLKGRDCIPWKVEPSLGTGERQKNSPTL